jgi:hypothetical protein
MKQLLIGGVNFGADFFRLVPVLDEEIAVLSSGVSAGAVNRWALRKA